ncbi:zinc dependent phospholipase C family protein [Leadbettera azotonutricia]|uniref:Uncharacterized protein n=1 Tax=Leadbettera azotonutricia (strain ATCC BAA-888 / DSM 13862 / ZAS-9) TaxID=545695 RepID=F5Y7Q1_LEAAZ|nr:zinc dependent phospholipase C family protein [Leadbettera azotonutricia]AEF81020.1 hypothetical protein TREAZ_1026 [Leadbettera azotonutricia ZAS-9]
MPSQILHTLFGEDVIAEIYRRLVPRFGLVAAKALEKISQNYLQPFFLGCQGPDIFYHSQMTRPVGLEYGTLLHRRGAGIFTAGLLKMGLPDPAPDEEDIRLHRREKGINALGAYALGFMTHALLDRACHPYIVYKSGWVSPRRPETLRYAKAHAFFERIIDALMLKIARGQETSSWDQEKALAEVCENPPLGLKELLARALVLAFPERAGRDAKLASRIDNTFADCAGFYRLTAPSKTMPGAGEALHPELLGLIYPVELPEDIDFLNLKHEAWFYPTPRGLEYQSSFPEIYSSAVETATDSIAPVITKYLASGIFPILEAAQAIGNGGLSIHDESGKPCAPTRAAPLPLDRVLEQQARIRGMPA